MRDRITKGRLTGIAGAAMLSMLCGCAVMSEPECLTADWYAVGERDGRDGRPLAHFAEYYEACSQFGVYPDEDAYQDGRSLGLTVYCTEDGGYREGRIGTGYRGVCPATLEPYFLAGYNAGISVRTTLQSVHRIDYDIDSRSEEIRNLKGEIDALESSGDGDAPEQESESTADGLKEMYRELGRLEAEQDRLRDEKVYAIVAYRRAVDVARSMGFYEPYEY